MWSLESTSSTLQIHYCMHPHTLACMWAKKRMHTNTRTHPIFSRFFQNLSWIAGLYAWRSGFDSARQPEEVAVSLSIGPIDPCLSTRRLILWDLFLNTNLFPQNFPGFFANTGKQTKNRRHPLKSELNFPTGPKSLIHHAPERWRGGPQLQDGSPYGWLSHSVISYVNHLKKEVKLMTG